MNYKSIILSVTALLFIATSVNALNVLGIFPYHGKSHFFVFRVYLQELVRRGHNVTVISHFPEAKPLKNYHDISLAGTTKILEDDTPFYKSILTLLNSGVYLVSSGIDNCNLMLANDKVQDLIKKKPKFDIIVVEQFNSDCALGVAYKLQAPVIGITSHILMPWQYSRFGIPKNPSFVPFHFLGYGTKANVWQKFKVTLLELYFNSLYFLIGQKSSERTLAKYFDDIPPLEDLAREIKFLLLYHNFILTGSRLFPANVKEVGGYHVAKAKPLTGDLLKFIDEAEHGIIFISFGSVLKSSTMPEDKLAAVLGAIQSLPQRFIWKWESETVLMNKDKLYVSSWLPQIDILGHPKTLAFLSHGGMGGTIEAIHYGVPIVAMPMFGDQPSNAAAIEESGLGVQLQVEDLSKENLLTAFNKVLDPKFKERVKQVSAAWHDRPIPPLDAAIFWTEFAARHSNFTFRAAAADVAFYQYLNLDLLLLYIVIILVVLVLLKYVISACCTSKKVVAKKSKKKTK